MSCTSLAVAGSDDHASTTVEHIASYIVDIRAFNALGATHHYIIGRVHTVAAGAVGAQQVVPAVAIDEVSGLTVDGDVFLFVAADTIARLGVDLDEADGAEVGAVADPHTTSGGVEQHAWVDGVLIFHTVAGAYFNSS